VCLAFDESDDPVEQAQAVIDYHLRRLFPPNGRG